MNPEIWLFLDSRSPGGIESHVLQLAEGLIGQGQRVRVVFLADHGPHPMRDALLNRDIPTDTLNGGFGSLRHRLRQAHPVLLHTHGYKAGILGRLAGWLVGIPVISTYHAGERPVGRLIIYDLIDRHTARLARRCLAVSPQIAARLPVSAPVLDNFIDTARLEPSTGQQIAFVGRLSEEKGPDWFLALAARFPGTDFHLYGGGPLQETLKAQAGPNCHFYGQQADMGQVWPRIALLVMPSRHEGLPMAALEAMGRGIPVLASQVGALDQLIETGINGWLVPAGDIDGLTAHLDQWLTMDEFERDGFQTAARKKVHSRFSAQVVIPQLLAIYRQARAVV